MKKIAIPVILGSALLFLASFLQSQTRPEGQSFDENVRKEQLVEAINSFSRLLADLAAERYSSSSNESVILTLHEGKLIEKYTDGKYTIVSLPIFQSSDRTALCVYVENYNAFHLATADKAVGVGRYSEAKELYEVLLHFTRCSDLTKEILEKRLPLLKKLEVGEENENNLKKFRELNQFYGTPPRRIDFSQIEKRATVVKNVLDIRQP